MSNDFPNWQTCFHQGGELSCSDPNPIDFYGIYLRIGLWVIYLDLEQESLLNIKKNKNTWKKKDHGNSLGIETAICEWNQYNL